MVVFGVLAMVALVPLGGLVAIWLLEILTDSQFRLRSIGGLLLLAFGSMTMAGIIGYVFLRTLLKPIQTLIERTAEIESGSDDAFRPMAAGTSEIATLAERFFGLARRLSERSDYLSLFATHVSHELKTPLTAITGATELLRDDMTAQERKHFLDNIEHDAARLTALSSRLRELAHADAARIGGNCDLRPVIEAACEAAGVTLKLSGPAMLDPSFTVAMAEDNAAIVWRQLADNAAKHGAIHFRVRVEQGEDGLTMLVGDDGEAISDNNRDQLLTPFFTTRREKGGTGMGLGIALAMLKGHGGEIEVSGEGEWKFAMRWKAAPR